MDRFGKFPVFVVLLALAMATGAAFGAVMGLFSSLLAPEYVRTVMIPNTGVAPGLGLRTGAMLAGVFETWEIAALISLPALGLGLLSVPRATSYLAAGIGAIGVIALTASFGALLGLATGLILADTRLVERYVTPPGADRPEALRAELMQWGAFFGASFGGFLAFWPMRATRNRDIERQRTINETQG